MNIQAVVLQHLAAVVAEKSPLPFPNEAELEMQLRDFWLDSVAFVDLLTRIEQEVGFIPMGILRGDAFPETIGELVEAYQREASAV